ncbi:MAG TPA: M3 family oligoendopeptidase [Candidatus Paceibacterota bacterium]|nr:M3 family oligoendopeptidase [Candidatus Paceibacterota bacterium]
MKLKTEWDLNRLFYTSLKDPKLARDVAAGEKAVDAFAKKYVNNKAWLTDPKALAEALKAYEALIVKSSSKPLLYANYRKELDTEDKEAEALMNKLDEQYTKRGNKLLFFELELAKAPAAAQKKFLASPELKEFRYWLKRLFENAKHNLSEPEERLMSLLSDVSFGRWVQAVSNILDSKTVVWKGKTMPLNEAQETLKTLATKERRSLYAVVNAAYKSAAQMAESELNAIVTRKKIGDELRGFEEPYDATILGYENDRTSILALVDTVTKHFGIAHRFYRAKAKLMKEKKLTYADRAAPVGSVKKKIPFEQAAEVVRETFRTLDPRYAEIFDMLLQNGQVDVYPKKGKTSGAYCSSTVESPTLVLLNHVDDAHSLLTLAHEMGHAVHAERSKTQRPFYQGHTISTAEVASTFFERAAFEALAGMLPESERLIALHDRAQDDVATVFRQIACFNFEAELHRTIRAKGLLPKEGIAALMNKHMAAYLGDAVTLAPDDGYFFVTWGHIRRFFYVYSYAYGLLISRALFEQVKKDPAFIQKVDAFLCAGGTASPEDIFAACGLDLYKPTVFALGLKGIEKDVAALEEAVSKKERI